MEDQANASELAGNGKEDRAEPGDNSHTNVVKTEEKAPAEYAYIDHKEFTSEAYKIEIANIPKYFGFGECKKLLKNTLGLNPHKIKNIPKIRKIYVTFKNDKDKEEALETLQGYEYKKHVLTVKSAKPKSDAMALKRETDGDISEIKEKRPKSDTDDDGTSKLSPQEILVSSVTKWHNVPYEEQLARKHSDMKEVLCKLRQKLGKANLDNEVFVWIMKHKNVSEGMCCPLNPILPSPVTTNYRNKSEFTVGLDTSGEKTVGYRLGKYRDQTCAVEKADGLTILPEVMKSVASKFQEYVRSSGKDTFNPQSYNGHWKLFTVRTTVNGEIMANVVVCKKDNKQNEIEKEKEDLKNYFQALKFNGRDVSTLLYQSVPTHRESGKDVEPPEVLFGNGYITEDLMDLKFQISPDSFFQCNTAAAKVLYSAIGRLLQNEGTCEESYTKNIEAQREEVTNDKPEKNIILFDVCCGTGTIGLTLASSVKRVIGIEMCEQAIENAKQNAEINDVENAEFHCGKAEDLLPALIKKYSLNSDDEIVAILDPPRPGMHPKVIQCLRRCPLLKKIIYVSCNPNACIPNFFDLCRPQSKRMPGLPFLPQLAQPVDLFPQTPHCELITVFKRISGEKKSETSEENEGPMEEQCSVDGDKE